MSGKTTVDSPLANVASGIEERRCDLMGRHRQLRDKVATLERSIPALMAYNMWMTDDKDSETPYHRVRQMIKELSPQPSSDPAERLLAELRSNVESLRQETAELHDKIIDADVKLEETTMELESLELANTEMEEKLTGLRDEVQRHSTPSLHSIHSEDLVCLKKIHQLAEEEFKLKNCIEELKSKETTYRRQMKQLLSCKKFRRDCERETERAQKPEGKGKRFYPENTYRYNSTEREYAFKDTEKKTCCSCPISISLTTRELPSKKSFDAYQSKSREKFHLPSACCAPLDCRETASQKSPPGCKPCQPTSTVTSKFESSRSTKFPCQFPLSASKANTSRSLKQLSRPSVPRDRGKACEKCEDNADCKQISNYKCICRGKCPRLLSTAPCNCSDTPLNSIDEVICQSAVTQILPSEPEADDSNSDEEFCECCSCGCDGSENSS